MDAQLISRGEAVWKRALAINRELDIASRQSADAEHDLSIALAKYNQLTETQAELTGCLTTVKQILDVLSTKHIDQIKKLLDIALRTIFYDRQYSVELEFDDKRGARTVEFFLIEHVTDEEGNPQIIKSAFDGGIGGGVLCVVGFVLQVYYIFYYKLNPILFADEAFSQLSDQYIDNLMVFIKQLADQRGMKIVLVAHDPRFIERADRTYQVEEGGKVTLIKEKKDV